MPCPKFPGLRQDALTGEVFIRCDLSSPGADGMPVPQNSPGSRRVPSHRAAAFHRFTFIFIFSNILPRGRPMAARHRTLAAQHHERVPGQAHGAHQGARCLPGNVPKLPGSACPPPQLRSAWFFFYIYFEADELAMCLV